jgi:alcohol dehydrogenase class IV
MQFTYNGQPSRVIFGAGSLQHLAREIDLLGAKRALVLSTPEQRASAEMIADLLGNKAAGVFDRAVMHVPIETAREARQMALALGADCAIAIGGGSTTGLGKAIALDSGLPILAIPTTYAGSEMTPIYGITEGGLKKTGKDARVLPRTTIYDPDLSMSLPVALSVTSGINAIAHAAEGLYAVDSNPIMNLMACEGIAALARALPAIYKNANDKTARADAEYVKARSDALYGAWLCGTVLGNVGMALHHKLCHTLGGSFNLPHAEVHTIVLPHALAYNQAAAPNAMQKIAKALGVNESQSTTAAQATWDLACNNGAPTSLAAIGLQESDLNKACDIAMQNQYANPRPLERVALRALFQDAFEGVRPR